MITIFLCALLNQMIFQHVTAERASTWDYCNCRWDAWSAWSQCSKSCGGGTQERNRKVWSKDIPECDSFENCATPGSGWDRTACNTHCEHGGTFQQFGTFGFCSCPKGLKGSCCEQSMYPIPPFIHIYLLRALSEILDNDFIFITTIIDFMLMTYFLGHFEL